MKVTPSFICLRCQPVRDFASSVELAGHAAEHKVKDLQLVRGEGRSLRFYLA